MIWDVYEGDVRGPMVAYWKGKVTPGTSSDHPSAFYDVMSTLAEVADAEVTNNTDVISLLPELL